MRFTLTIATMMYDICSTHDFWKLNTISWHIRFRSMSKQPASNDLRCELESACVVYIVKLQSQRMIYMTYTNVRVTMWRLYGCWRRMGNRRSCASKWFECCDVVASVASKYPRRKVMHIWYIKSFYLAHCGEIAYMSYVAQLQHQCIASSRPTKVDSRFPSQVLEVYSCLILVING